VAWQTWGFAGWHGRSLGRGVMACPIPPGVVKSILTNCYSPKRDLVLFTIRCFPLISFTMQRLADGKTRVR